MSAAFFDYPVDLVRESETRTLQAAWRVNEMSVEAMSKYNEIASWPDPYGPDHVVFGAVPRVGAHVIGLA